MPRESGLLDHIAIIVKWRRMIITACVVVTVATAVVSMVMPTAYRASAVVYPPNQGSDMLGLSSLVGDLPMGLLGLGEGGVSATDFVPVLQSQRVAEAVAEKFNLKEIYEVTTREELLMAISGRLEVGLSREQFLSVSYEASTPQAAADLANAFVDELDRALRERKRDQASSLRQYLETRLAEAEADVNQAELAYNGFQKEHMAIDLESQAKAQIETTGTLVAILAEQIIKKEVAGRMMDPDNPKLSQLDLEISATLDAVDRILMGSADGTKNPSPEMPGIIIPFNQVPDLGLRALQLMRDIEIQNAIYKFVRTEYEKARLEEDKEITQVIPLDRAHPPDSRSRPARTMMVMLAGLLSLVMSTLLAYILESLSSMDQTDLDKLSEIKRDWQS
jgi:tyrosine-protein kinase Etk/Wzc